ncbi:hypothetical protein CLV67_13020 [Actinoplanes italicus]|uniref:Quercetin dioxygenase-like cupin family protein n=1 Tax=Actinoplanes italicus TaxID=113567 RepID=A0A2T0JWD8_9ACTN|nr:hypothetical protein CLV67_13020 [Actinoplanes italicus]
MRPVDDPQTAAGFPDDVVAAQVTVVRRMTRRKRVEPPALQLGRNRRSRRRRPRRRPPASPALGRAEETRPEVPGHLGRHHPGRGSSPGRFSRLALIRNLTRPYVVYRSRGPRAGRRPPSRRPAPHRPGWEGPPPTADRPTPPSVKGLASDAEDVARRPRRAAPRRRPHPTSRPQRAHRPRWPRRDPAPVPHRPGPRTESRRPREPGEATLQVLRGRVRLSAGDDSADASSGELLVIPDAPRRLDALQGSVILLTVAKRP